MAQVTVNTPPLPADPDSLVEALLYSVSHDLRSPLLTLSLAGELIAESLGGGCARSLPAAGRSRWMRSSTVPATWSGCCRP